jgi:signal transduction histidine kinase
MLRLDGRENCRIEHAGGAPTVNARSLVLPAAGSLLAGGAAAALWSTAGGSQAGAAALLAATAFAAGCLAALRSPGGPPAEASPELEAARLEAFAARRELEALQSSVAHDLRSPVGAVLNFATVLELDHGQHLDEGARDIVERIRNSAEAALGLLDALSRLTGVTRAPLRPAALDMEPLVRRAYAEARPGAPRPALSLDPLPRVVADPALLHTAFVELFDNALKFGAACEAPRVSVGGRRDADGTLVYWVADSGVGFDMRFAGKLFGVFARLHSRDEFPGAGVGLAIVRRIAERHGGRAWAEAEPGRGARVFLALPGEAAACA